MDQESWRKLRTGSALVVRYLECRSEHRGLRANVPLLQPNGDAQHPQKVHNGALLDPAEFVAGTGRDVRALRDDPVVHLHQVGHKIFRLQRRDVFDDELGLTPAVLAWEPDRRADGLLDEMVEYFSVGKELVSPVVAVVDENQEAGAPKPPRNGYLGLASLLPLPAAVQGNDHPAVAFLVKVDALPVLPGALKRAAFLFADGHVEYLTNAMAAELLRTRAEAAVAPAAAK